MAATLHARGYESDRLAACMFRLLAANALCSIASRSESGAVHISTAFYSYSRDPVLHFLSHPDSVHCHNLKGVPQIAVAVFDSRQPWGAPHAGLQLFGTGMPTSGPELHEVRGEYAARFPRFGELLRGAAPAGPTFGALRFYSFVPDRVQLLDEWEFGEDVFVTAAVLR